LIHIFVTCDLNVIRRGFSFCTYSHRIGKCCI